MVAIDADGDPTMIVAYFAFPSLIPRRKLSGSYRKAVRIGRLRAVPGAFLARLGVDQTFQGQRVGEHVMGHIFEGLPR